MGSETAGGSQSEEHSSGDGFALHCVHKHLIHSVDTNYHLGDQPLISSYMSLYTQAEILQKCLMAMHYLIFNTCSSFPCRLVTFGLMAQAACSQSKVWLQGGQGAGVMKASSMETGKSADIVLPCSLAHRVEPGLGGVPLLIPHSHKESHLSLLGASL